MHLCLYKCVRTHQPARESELHRPQPAPRAPFPNEKQAPVHAMAAPLQAHVAVRHGGIGSVCGRRRRRGAPAVLRLGSGAAPAAPHPRLAAPRALERLERRRMCRAPAPCEAHAAPAARVPAARERERERERERDRVCVWKRLRGTVKDSERGQSVAACQCIYTLVDS